MNNYDRVHEAIKKYLEKNPEDGETNFYVVVKEYWGSGLPWNTVYKVEIEMTGAETFNSIFAVDYDEGQKIDILRVIPEHEVENILFDYTYKEATIDE